MSDETVELAHRSFDAFNRRDLDAYLTLMDPSVETITRIVPLEGHAYNGHEGVRHWWRDLFAIFPDFSAEILEMRDPGDFVIALVGVRGHGLDSGTPFEEQLWLAGEWRHGKAVWWQTFEREAEALEAVRLRE
jgi:ketosteroid isomerase-like protein